MSRRRLDLASLERWLASPAGRGCVHRRGRPGSGERPLVAEAARCFDVDRRTVERALARLARRRRLLAEHLPIDPASAAHLLDAAKSFVTGVNAAMTATQMRQTAAQGTSLSTQQGLTMPATPDRRALVAAVRSLIDAGWLHPDEVQPARPIPAPSRSPWEAIGLRPMATARPAPLDPLTLSIQALLDAMDAVQAAMPADHPVQPALSTVRTALAQG